MQDSDSQPEVTPDDDDSYSPQTIDNNAGEDSDNPDEGSGDEPGPSRSCRPERPKLDDQGVVKPQDAVDTDSTGY
ncbi:hypothetical protein NDU88_001547 [Pleurodeles waltl]|uniref:Uncharacterized protein n=1 Tax=Pleurodeles waltl TaxID=8319 RepID=A0AAV7P5U7_PLEWA|nr:hypothetical protein NDU88_001547 [Pleurodeles waltl]